MVLCSHFLLTLLTLIQELEDNLVQVNSCHSSFVLVLVVSLSNESLKKRQKYVDQS
jgi:hypothetical protein